MTDSIFVLNSKGKITVGIDMIDSREPTPEFAAEFADTCEFLFQRLNDAALRMEGSTDSEIAAKLNCSRRTVQRRLEVIRRQWDRLETSND